MRLTRNSCDVLIGGAGIAAAATALRLCDLGFRPLMLARTCRIVPGVEAIPEIALPLFTALGAGHILQDAGAMWIEGFENHWDPEKPSVRSGHWIHVERDRLASAAMREAVKRGTTFRVCQTRPKLRQESDSVCATYDGDSFRFEAAIDATGRSAVWSRPVRRRGNQTADLYNVWPDEVGPARVVRLPEGWGYKISVPNSATMAIVSASGTRRHCPDSFTQKAFGAPINSCTFVGRRPAFSQWSESPVLGRRLAVGDAALAYDPRAGQGVRFALSSAITASAVVNTWRTAPSETAAAADFYSAFVARSRQAHFSFIDQLETKSSHHVHRAEAMPEVVMFSGQTVRVGLQLRSKIRTRAAILLPDGDCVRWIGGVDLLELRNSMPQQIRSANLVERLRMTVGSLAQARGLLEWCLQHDVLRSASSASPSNP
jgi:2-polyprenyl-6-methoxyphenol hydroxylase-like FAD-dependent oxidoreductase